MPKIFEYFGFIFYFFSNEHEPIDAMDYIYVVSAEDAGNLCVRLTFNDGHKSVVDIGEFIRQHPHPQYNKYLDPELFRTFTIDDGNVVWGEDWDLIFPVENLYSGKAA